MIKRDDIIGDILKKKPEAAKVLMELGMGCLGCPSATMENLEQACEIHGLDLEEVLSKINAI